MMTLSAAGSPPLAQTLFSIYKLIYCDNCLHDSTDDIRFFNNLFVIPKAENILPCSPTFFAINNIGAFTFHYGQ